MGKPKHMKSIVNALRAVYPVRSIHILNSKYNSGSLTYDGIDVCAERLVLEIEEELESIRSRGNNITKISIVGYSLGGLVARYAVGLLESRGFFIDIEPMVCPVRLYVR
jgi:triacylglycerol esterase/lipase EstA (alpha/beta hydrolase family)